MEQRWNQHNMCHCGFWNGYVLIVYFQNPYLYLIRICTNLGNHRYQQAWCTFCHPSFAPKIYWRLSPGATWFDNLLIFYYFPSNFFLHLILFFCFLQECGRAGRDGQRASCILYYNYSDYVSVQMLLYFLYQFCIFFSS